MKIAAIDDEFMALQNLRFKIKEVRPDAVCETFQDEEEFLKWVRSEKPDVVFMDIDMQPRNGMEIAEDVQQIFPDCAIIFLTGYSEYAVDAFKMKVNGYLMKPVSTEDLEHEFEFLEESAANAGIKAGKNKLKVRCFGNFEVFKDDEIIKFRRMKSKELFAYLIDRHGSTATMAEIASVLWADGIFDHSRNNQIHSFLNDLNKSLEDGGVKDVIVKTRNSVSVNMAVIDCDYYNFLNGDAHAMNEYNGEYMSQYWWAEFTAGELYSKITDSNNNR